MSGPSDNDLVRFVKVKSSQQVSLTDAHKFMSDFLSKEGQELSNNEEQYLAKEEVMTRLRNICHSLETTRNKLEGGATSKIASEDGADEAVVNTNTVTGEEKSISHDGRTEKGKLKREQKQAKKAAKRAAKKAAKKERKEEKKRKRQEEKEKKKELKKRRKQKLSAYV